MNELEQNSLDITPVLLLLEQFLKVCCRNCFTVNALPSPLVFAARDAYGFDEKSKYDKDCIPKAIEILASTSLDFNGRDHRYDTLLHAACSVGSKEVVEALLNSADKKRMDINAAKHQKLLTT